MCNNRCSRCKNIVLVLESSVDRGFLTLTLPDTNICNNDRVCFIIPSSIELPNEPTPVRVSINGVDFFWLSKSGSFVYSDQLRARRLYIGRLRTDNNVLMNERCNLGSTSMNFTVIPIPRGTKEVKTIKGSEVNDK